MTQEYDKLDGNNGNAFGLLLLSDVNIDAIELQEEVDFSSLSSKLRGHVPPDLVENLVEGIGSPWKWLKDDVESAKFAFGPGESAPEFTYEGIPIKADFELSYEGLAPYVTSVVDEVDRMGGYGFWPSVVTIKNKAVDFCF